jgi:hypothetical protein
MFSKFRGTFKVLGMIIVPVVLVMFIGCSSDSSPTGVEENPTPEPEIQTPRSLIVQKITVTSFPANNPDGDTWDFNILDEYARRPDIYIMVTEKNSSDGFRSVTEDDAVYNGNYDLSDNHRSSDKSLPYDMDYKDAYTITLYDDDGILKDDEIGTADFYPSDYYSDNNATTFYRFIDLSNGVKVRLEGTWSY